MQMHLADNTKRPTRTCVASRLEPEAPFEGTPGPPRPSDAPWVRRRPSCTVLIEAVLPLRAGGRQLAPAVVLLPVVAAVAARAVVAASAVKSLGLPVRLPDVLAVGVALIECHGLSLFPHPS
jgi:hypothetical protein